MTEDDVDDIVINKNDKDDKKSVNNDKKSIKS
jgi:hypothetical protein